MCRGGLYIYIMGYDFIDWNRVKKLIIDIAEADGDMIFFDTDKAIGMGYTAMERVVAEQIIQKREPVPDEVSRRLNNSFADDRVAMRAVYISEVELIFVIFPDKGCFIVINESGLI